jgi:hypothetical protein
VLEGDGAAAGGDTTGFASLKSAALAEEATPKSSKLADASQMNFFMQTPNVMKASLGKPDFEFDARNTPALHDDCVTLP